MSEKSSETDNLQYGCQHYKRRCAFVSPCCNNVYPCRLCHNEKEKHEINRHAVKRVKCTECNTVQDATQECTKCGVCFGKYFCPVCNLYDDADKGQFHCTGCGICRIGGKQNFFHCEICNSCLSITMKAEHKCIENASHATCPVCLEDMHSSRDPIHVPRCGHHIHRQCFIDMTKHGGFTCPLCGESYSDMAELWDRVDEEIASTPMPDEYKDFKVTVLCKDCHKESSTLFHVIGLKCQPCGSYNTCRAAGDGENDPDGLTQSPANTGGEADDGNNEDDDLALV